jgi:hypothetical protein
VVPAREAAFGHPGHAIASDSLRPYRAAGFSNFALLAGFYYQAKIGWRLSDAITLTIPGAQPPRIPRVSLRSLGLRRGPADLRFLSASTTI